MGIILHVCIISLAAQSVAYWKNGVLDFYVVKVTPTFATKEDEFRHRYFNAIIVASNVQY